MPPATWASCDSSTMLGRAAATLPRLKLLNISRAFASDANDILEELRARLDVSAVLSDFTFFTSSLMSFWSPPSARPPDSAFEPAHPMRRRVCEAS